MLAVHMVCRRRFGIRETVDSMVQHPDRVSKWAQGYREGGSDALRDLLKTSRPPKVPKKTTGRTMARATGSGTAPAMLRQDIHKRTGIRPRITYIQKPMHRYGLTPRVPQLIRANRATDGADGTTQKTRLRAQSQRNLPRLPRTVALHMRPPIRPQVPVPRKREGAASRTLGTTKRPQRTAQSRRTAGSCPVHTRGLTARHSRGM